MSRRLKLSVALVAILLVLGAAILWALPEVVRRMALVELPKLTGRAVSIEDVDINVFTGRVAIKKFRVAEREPSETFARLDRLDLWVSPWSFVSGHIRVRDLTLTTPTIRIVRTGPTEFNFSDLLALIPPPDPAKPPSRWTVDVERLALVDGGVSVSDRAVSPAREWQIRGLGVQAGGFSTAPGRPPGHVEIRAHVNDAALNVRGDSVRLSPTGAAAQISLQHFDLAQVRPYLPTTLPAVLQSGMLGIDLKVSVERGSSGFQTMNVTGKIGIEGLAMSQPDRDAPFLNVSRLGVSVKEGDVLARSLTLAAIEADGVDLRAVRTAAGEIDLLATLKQRQPAEPSPESAGGGATPAVSSSASTPPFKARLERLSVTSANVTLVDEAVSGGREWKLDGMTVEGTGLGTAPEDAGTLKLRARVLSRPGSGGPSTLSLDADSVRLSPASASAHLKIEGFDLSTLQPYWPDTLPAVARAGSFGADVKLGVDSGPAGLTRAVASGSVTLANASLVQRGAQAPFVGVPRLVVNVKEVDLLAHRVALGTVDITGVDLKAMRDAAGQIDVLALTAVAPRPARVLPPPVGSPGPPAAAPAGTAATTGTGAATTVGSATGWRISLDRFTLDKGTATFEDRAVSPAGTFTITGIKMTADRVAWPMTTPATFTLLMAMPTGGWSYVKGTAILEPLNVQVAISTRDTPISPYQTYFPFAAQLKGLFNGDSLSEIQRGSKGELILASRGTAWANEVEVTAPGGGDPVVRMDSQVIKDIDFSWPNYALVGRVVLAHPQIRVERDAQGNINLRTLFEVRKDEQAKDATAPPPAASAPSPAPAGGGTTGDRAPGGILQNMVIDFNEIDVVNGFARFIDHTTTPPFSEDISRLRIKIQDLSNVLGRPKQTSITVQGLVGVDGALDMRGALSGIGETLRGDLVAELRDFSLKPTNPYAESLTSWNIEGGTLQARIHYHIEGDRITAEHDLAFKKLRVAKAREGDEAKRRIGIPLGLAVALLKDSQGNIDFSFPLGGTLSDRNFNWGEAIWGAVKQVIGKVLLSPFHAIGRLFSGDGGDKLEVNPVTFSPGSAVIAPSLEAQLTQVADFLQRSPQIKLGLTAVITARDADSLKRRAVNARIEALRREQRLPDLASGVREYWKTRFPDVAPPPTVAEQLASLAQREPIPEQALADLAQRRLDAVQDDLVKARGIPADRLVRPAVGPATATPSGEGDGRVDLNIVTDSG